MQTQQHATVRCPQLPTQDPDSRVCEAVGRAFVGTVRAAAALSTGSMCHSPSRVIRTTLSPSPTCALLALLSAPRVRSVLRGAPDYARTALAVKRGVPGVSTPGTPGFRLEGARGRRKLKVSLMVYIVGCDQGGSPLAPGHASHSQPPPPLRTRRALQGAGCGVGGGAGAAPRPQDTHTSSVIPTLASRPIDRRPVSPASPSHLRASSHPTAMLIFTYLPATM